ncbi:major facilitator superfamily domain-containing protein [Xylaria palmicola]|nr:major facilitator superfamily domain-containing protein [Xylaria palmicola]
MDRTERISLHELPPSDARHEPVVGGVDDDGTPTTPDAADARQAEANMKRTLVLLGASLSQLPIWGFSMSYGVFQEYYVNHWTLGGSRAAAGVIGTTSNGVLYLAMPLLFAAFTRRWAARRREAAVAGAVLAAASLALSSLATHAAHLVATQGVLAALGCALVYSPTTLSLSEWFSGAGGGGRNRRRAVAYGVTLSCKNVVGSVVPFLARALLENLGFRVAVRVWAAVVLVTSLLSIALIPTHPSVLAAAAAAPAGEEEEEAARRRRRAIPWHFLGHRTFYVYALAIALQSAGYGIPQSYLPTYAREVARLSQTSATLLLTVFNVPGILASSLFGYLSDRGGDNNNNSSNGNRRLLPSWSSSATTATAVSAASSALAALLLWGLAARGGLAQLLVFSATFGFFAGGYSATWGGVVSELEGEAARRNEAVDPGMLYGLLNGARGVGYVAGGLASVPLLRAGGGGGGAPLGASGYASAYGPLILFTGLSSAFGGWGILWKWAARIRRLS